MAVTTPELLRPDGLTVTISQVPGVSPTRDIGWGDREVEVSPVSGEDNCPCSASPTYSSEVHPQLSTSCSPGRLLSPSPQRAAAASPTAPYIYPKALASRKPQPPGGQRNGAEGQEQWLRDKGPLSKCSGFPGSAMMGHCGILGPWMARGPG